VTLAAAMLEALKVAARDYVEATEGPAEPLAGMQAAARLRLAAKDWVRAERDARAHRTGPGAV
jgi:hypothetical protein